MRTDCVKLNSHKLNTYEELINAQKTECLKCEDSNCGSSVYVTKSKGLIVSPTLWDMARENKLMGTNHE